MNDGNGAQNATKAAVVATTTANTKQNQCNRNNMKTSNLVHITN